MNNIQKRPVLFLVASIVKNLCKYKAEDIIRRFYHQEVQILFVKC